MNKKLWLAVSAVAMLAGCACWRSAPDPANPKVYVIDGYLVVDQEPLIVKGDRPITWHLQQTGPYRFASSAIELRPTKDLKQDKDPRNPEEMRRDLNCKAPENDGHDVTCTPNLSFLFKGLVPRHYSITVEDTTRGNKPLILDPSMIPR